MIKQDWKLPEPPEGFDIPVAFYYANGEIELDWTREPERDFASEYEELNGQGTIEYPFVDGIKTSHKLWESVGISPIN